jgi:Pyruvate/2-oxoacid:ferredoxin oxidoreductase delta subunit
MEGNGPRGGTPIAMNVILVSSDPVALDATVCRMVDLNPEYVPTTSYGMEVGMGTYKEDEIEIFGESIEDFKVKDFNVVREPVKPMKSGGAFTKIANQLFVPRPYIETEKCVKCGVCVLMCPVNPKAVHWDTIQDDAGIKKENKAKPPVYSYDRCIRCYCCQELCPESVIRIKVPILRKIFGSKSIER